EPRDERVEPAHPEIEHEALVGGEVVARLTERSEDEVSALGAPRPLARLALGRAARSDAEVVLVPGGERIRILRAEEESADRQHHALTVVSHRRSPCRRGVRG